MKPEKYPYQDIETPLLEGEEWRPISGYEGYYEVSNLGRARSLDRVIPHPRLYSQRVKGRILKQKVQINKNTVSDQPMIDLQVSLSKDGKQHYRNIRRLVYAAFIAPISYQEDKQYVVNKDCDGYNNHVENLELVSIKKKSARAFSRGRVPESYLSYADRSKWKKEHGGMSRRKPVVQLNMNDEIVAVYQSVSEAARQAGFDEKGIIGTAKHRYKSWGGYVWRYQSEYHYVETLENSSDHNS